MPKLPSLPIRVSVVEGKLMAQANLHDLAVSLRARADDFHQSSDDDSLPPSLILRTLADELEAWRRVAIGEWMDRNQT
jgi:hypothetical protein